MKKLFKASVAIALLVGGGSITHKASASQKYVDTRVVYHQKEITDLNELYQRAKENITDYKGNNPETIGEEVEVIKNGKKVKDGKVYKTTQLLNQTTDDEGNIDSSYVSTTFANDFETVAAASSTGNSTRDKWDSSYSVRAYSTVYFDISSHDNTEYRDITKVTGGWEIDDNSITVSGQSLLIGQSGGAYGHGAVSQTKSYNISNLTFSQAAPSAWYPVSTVVGSIGATTTATLKRSGTTWTLKLQNNN